MSSAWSWLLVGVDRLWVPLATPLGVILALAATGHILLHKRDVTASIAWIGLAWLVPVWGALLYVLFGVNRVVRRARDIRPSRPQKPGRNQTPTHDYALHLRQLDQAAGRITGSSSEGGNAVHALVDGDEAYPRMLQAIAGARTSIALATFIFAEDAVGERFVAALAEAARRGVAVRVLLDGIGSGYFPPIARVLKRAGLTTALFMHSALPWRMPFLNLRNHKKLLVVDGELAFLGGLNIQAACLLSDHPKHPVADTHFAVTGPIVMQLLADFAQDWTFTTGEALGGPAWFPDVAPCGTCVARVVSSGPDQHLEHIQMVLLEAISCATRSITIMTPYFLPAESLVTALALASLRGVDVTVVVPRRSNKRFIDRAMRAHVSPLLDHKVAIWLGRDPFNHSKLMVVDEVWCFVGSANWDIRSLRLNFELNLEIYSKTLAQELTTMIDAHRRQRLSAEDLQARNFMTHLWDAGLRLLLPYV